MSFKENLKAELQFQDMQIKELSLKTGINKNTLGNYLTGHNSIPNADSAVKIAKALNVTVEYLVTGEDSSISQKSPDLLNIIRTIQNLDSIDLNSINQLVVAMQKRY
ncbi:MAG: helix-turn-helix transcriptional regulator [Treponema sp.]|nr:helix-turn-helix transcriptional regulator [Treponema sp.]MBR0545662.1 helix-turn-helix transcriptional regulator [Treponema sp.]MDY2825703.1 helix-turn-helix transcriptional regulator [Treponema sp.]MDY4766889.1 helix-turn-helix transcriptional regulator [Treponema sp.]